MGRGICSCLLPLGETIHMAELREAHLRYLLAIHELGWIKPDVGTQDIAKTLGCAKASVTKMAGILMEMNLPVRERYGKIYLTDTKDLPRRVEVICERFPALELALTEEENEEYIRKMAVRLPEHCRKPCAAVLLGGKRKNDPTCIG